MVEDLFIQPQGIAATTAEIQRQVVQVEFAQFHAAACTKPNPDRGLHFATRFDPEARQGCAAVQVLRV